MRIGMDFGTTNSGIAHYDGDQLRLLPLDPAAPNPAVARTALYLTHDRQLHFGQSAITNYYEQNLNRPVQLERVHVGEIELTFAELPTFHRDVYIERDVFSPGRLFLSFKSSLPSQGYLGTAVGEDYYLLEDIIALYLYSARRRAEQALDAELTEVVLGRPVRYSDDPEQDALAQARMLQAAFLRASSASISPTNPSPPPMPIPSAPISMPTPPRPCSSSILAAAPSISAS